MKGFIDSLGTAMNYKNLSDEVEIILENNIDENLSLYTVTNKNGVTFQNVPGMAWIGFGQWS
ncbi:MAG: hypothetical protein MRK02_10165 [Candidatus Scalindua sp.]|nr:hypothetical protein [Candidatus Scalindua sp.]